MTDLADFLLACFAEDEAVATDEAIARARAGTVVGGPGVPAHAVEQAQEAVADVYRVRPWAHIASPARVLAECEAKRRIVEDLRDLSGEDADDQAWALQYGDNAQQVAIRTLRLLALPYADHPDFREEWRAADS